MAAGHYAFISLNTESFLDELVRQIELEPVFETASNSQSDCEIPAG